jgi:AbrB family looped-hinge helix DNA binding protein
MAERAVLRSKGQLTLPTEIRRLAGLNEGDLLEFEVVEGRIVITNLKAVDPEDAWFWTDEWQEGERQAAADFAAGRSEFFESTEAFLAALDAID